MKIGDKINAFGEEFEILDIGPRSRWEGDHIHWLGQGVVGLNLGSGVKEYFYDFDVDGVVEALLDMQNN